MRTTLSACRALAAVGLLTTLAFPVQAQDAGARVGGPGRQGSPDWTAPGLARTLDAVREAQLYIATRRSELVVRDAPYSGDGVTTTTQTLADGTKIQQTTRTRVWRDRMGRVRREQTTVGLGALSPSDTAAAITIEDPLTSTSTTLNPAARAARTMPLVTTRAAVRLVARQPGSESLGTREMEGVKVTGTRTTTTIATGQIGNDRPIVTTDERWESPDLQVLVYSRQSDPRTGTVEYRLSNINRSEPTPDLFTVPAGYTTTSPAAAYFDTLQAPSPGPGNRTGGRGGRGGGRSNAVESPLPEAPQPQ